MITNPITVLDNKWVTFPGVRMDPKQLQPNGIDVRLKSAQRICGHRLYLSQNETTHCDKTDVIADDDGNLDFETLEYAKIPENSVAMVYGRSTLNRNGILIRSSLYDSGFENYIGFTMYAFSGLRTQVGVRLAQIVFYPAEYSRLYNGQYMTNALPMRGA